MTEILETEGVVERASGVVQRPDMSVVTCACCGEPLNNVPKSIAIRVGSCPKNPDLCEESVRRTRLPGEISEGPSTYRCDECGGGKMSRLDSSDPNWLKFECEGSVKGQKCGNKEIQFRVLG